MNETDAMTAWDRNHRKDGTARAREPYQDEHGNWTCAACGRAHGFKSKHAVLGHLRACRPGVASAKAPARNTSPSEIVDAIVVVRAAIMATNAAPDAAEALAGLALRSVAGLEQALLSESRRLTG